MIVIEFMAMEKRANNGNKEYAILSNHICEFIADKFLRKAKDRTGRDLTQNKYALEVGLSSSTLSKIKFPPEDYRIPLSTIYSICNYEKYPLSKFFKEFEDKYGEDILR